MNRAPPLNPLRLKPQIDFPLSDSPDCPIVARATSPQLCSSDVTPKHPPLAKSSTPFQWQPGAESASGRAMMMPAQVPVRRLLLLSARMPNKSLAIQEKVMTMARKTRAVSLSSRQNVSCAAATTTTKTFTQTDWTFVKWPSRTRISPPCKAPINQLGSGRQRHRRINNLRAGAS